MTDANEVKVVCRMCNGTGVHDGRPCCYCPRCCGYYDGTLFAGERERIGREWLEERIGWMLEYPSGRAVWIGLSLVSVDDLRTAFIPEGK